MPVVNLQWTERDYFESWQSDDTVILYRGDLGPVAVDAATGAILSQLTPTPTKSHDLPSDEEPSINGDFEIACTEDELVLSHLPEHRVISQTNLHLDSCWWQVGWAEDSLAAAFIVDTGDVYVWRTDGTPPYTIGNTNPRASYPPQWSPNNDKLLVISRLPPPHTPDAATFNIYYPDGRPVNITGAVIAAGNGWEFGSLFWLTNDILENWRTYGGGIAHKDYYHADSGKFLFRNELVSNGGQEVVLSPDKRWFAAEIYPYSEVWWEDLSSNGIDYGDEHLLVLYDLRALKKRVWATAVPAPRDDLWKGAGRSFELIGWSPDSRQFYFVYYPYSNLSADLAPGYTVLDPGSLKTCLLIPNVLHTQLSPDGQHIFMVTADHIEPNLAFGVQGALYTLDGQRITEPVFIAEQLPFDELFPCDTDFLYYRLIPVRWNHSATDLVFAGPNGDLWQLSTDGQVRQLVSDLPAEEYWQEDVRLRWSPNGRFLILQWQQWAWIVQVDGFEK